MSGGGGSTPSTSTTVTQSLPEYARPYYEGLLGRTTYETARPYVAYPSRRLADFSGRESEAMQGIADFARTPIADSAVAQVGMEAAEGIAGINPYQDKIDEAVAGFNPGQFDPGSVRTSVYSYMDPYSDLVTDIRKREAKRESDIMSNQIADQATAAGGLGGYREAIMQAERQRNLAQQLDDIQNTGNLDAYLNAQQAFESDKARELSAAQLGVDTAATKAGLVLDGYGAVGSDMTRRADVFSRMADATSEEQRLTLQRLNALRDVGASERSLSQKGLDIGYDDFIRQQAFPREQLSFYSSILQGVPVQPGQTTAAFGTRPTEAQQWLGAGIGGIGLYNALGNRGP